MKCVHAGRKAALALWFPPQSSVAVRSNHSCLQASSSVSQPLHVFFNHLYGPLCFSSPLWRIKPKKFGKKTLINPNPFGSKLFLWLILLVVHRPHSTVLASSAQFFWRLLSSLVSLCSTLFTHQQPFWLFCSLAANKHTCLNCRTMHVTQMCLNTHPDKGVYLSVSLIERKPLRWRLVLSGIFPHTKFTLTLSAAAALKITRQETQTTKKTLDCEKTPSSFS